MQIIRDLKTAHLDRPTVATIGTFDGVHLGHQALIGQIKEAAWQKQAQSAVVAFHPRPKTVLAPHLLPVNDYLTTPEERISLFDQLYLDILILTPFTLALAQTTAYDFMKLLVEGLNLVELWVGHDFALGKNREGTVKRLRELGQELGYNVQEVNPLLVEGKVVSSTQIRQLLLAGEVRQAAELLGRYPSLTGTIVQGVQRGRQLGFPTANFAIPPERLLPANGVYATYIRYQNQGQRYPSVTNVGVRPSFNDVIRTVETFVFDFNQNLYGQELTVEFVEHLRPEKKFGSIEELKAQISRDSQQARAILAGENQSYDEENRPEPPA